jgi:hypothetical protein
MNAVYEVILLLGAEGVSDNRHLAMRGKAFAIWPVLILRYPARCNGSGRLF